MEYGLSVQQFELQTSFGIARLQMKKQYAIYYTGNILLSHLDKPFEALNFQSNSDKNR